MIEPDSFSQAYVGMNPKSVRDVYITLLSMRLCQELLGDSAMVNEGV